GLMASGVLATSFLFIALARAATTDMLLTAGVTGAIISFNLATEKRGSARLAYVVFSGVALGVAVLAKGLVGIVFVSVLLDLAFLVTRTRPLSSWYEFLLLLVVFLLVTLAWYVPVTIANGRAFIDEFFINQQFRRYISNRYQHPQPFWFLPVIVLAGALPWT